MLSISTLSSAQASGITAAIALFGELEGFMAAGFCAGAIAGPVAAGIGAGVARLGSAACGFFRGNTPPRQPTVELAQVVVTTTPAVAI